MWVYKCLGVGLVYLGFETLSVVLQSCSAVISRPRGFLPTSPGVPPHPRLNSLHQKRSGFVPGFNSESVFPRFFTPVPPNLNGKAICSVYFRLFCACFHFSTIFVQDLCIPLPVSLIFYIQKSFFGNFFYGPCQFFPFQGENDFPCLNLNN